MSVSRSPSSDEFETLQRRVEQVEQTMAMLRDASVKGAAADAAQAEQTTSLWGEITILRQESQKILESVTRAETITIHLSRALERVPEQLYHHETELQATSNALTDHGQRLAALEQAESSAAHRRRALSSFGRFLRTYWPWIVGAAAFIATIAVQVWRQVRG